MIDLESLTDDEFVTLGACVGEVSAGYKTRFCAECSKVLADLMHPEFFLR